MNASPRLLTGALFLTVLSSAALADTQNQQAGFTAGENGIYRVDAKGQRSLIVKPKSDELFVDTSLSISPNQSWALINHVPGHPGAGRIEEARVLISLRNGTRIEPDAFKKKYGEWLGELADWADNAPSTIELESGKKIPLR